MQKQKVIKKNGQSQDFAPAKVKKIIDVAGSGFSLDSSKVVEKLPDFFQRRNDNFRTLQRCDYEYVGTHFRGRAGLEKCRRTP